MGYSLIQLQGSTSYARVGVYMLASGYVGRGASLWTLGPAYKCCVNSTYGYENKSIFYRLV